jgi:hypothetical protein
VEDEDGAENACGIVSLEEESAGENENDGVTCS